ncbi:DOMON-like domain-containing protein [uncultured Brevundimonas sp.]|uniref:DOMON-like domain-containing protein n=1 Tax=uncultured Brevundimonas sp. TaxID=213418 RepID=UPI0025CDE3E0|nr:DOMON-like domain-containing protein [uncultured Brevundimonas sp.]
MRLPLIPHPTTSPAGLMLEVEAKRAGRVLSLEYVLAGPVERVWQPEAAARVRTDGLWQATCFEAFVRTEAGGYIEYNLSPSGAWAAYRFDGYREGMRDLEMPAPFIVTRSAPGQFVLTADVALPEDAVGATGLKTGLAAVIRGVDGAIGYWALAHPSDKPDFHHPDSFALDLT